VILEGGKRSILARKIDPTRLSYPKRMLGADRPFSMPDREPLVLRINDRLSLTCIAIPPGKFLMGTPHYMWPYYVEEYPHLVTLTKRFYLAEVPVTQEMFDAVMGHNPSTIRDPQLPVQDPRFAEIEQFCAILSRRNGKNVRLPTDAEWEYAARVGTSNPGFPEKFAAQNSSGPDGFKRPMKVRLKSPNAWGLYDMASCWWEITADRGMYNVRQPEIDPRYPPKGPDIGKVQRSGRGIIKENWSIGTHEFLLEKGYAGQKFRVAVDADAAAKK
jgi:formylglycine-generating enzyme required for sulfatase activity